VLVIAFAALALTLAGVGIYGVTAFSVATRRSEIGIRRALGATDHRVVLAVVRRVGLLTAFGVVIGLIGAATGGRMLSSLLIGVSPTDPAILAAVAALIATVAGGAALVPVLRALQVDPTESLRSEYVPQRLSNTSVSGNVRLNPYQRVKIWRGRSTSTLLPSAR